MTTPFIAAHEHRPSHLSALIDYLSLRHLLGACADCYAWLVRESPRIAEDWLCWPGWDLSLAEYGRLIYEGASIKAATEAERQTSCVTS